jgi:beta-galactosidase/beta-glucuronidase
MNTPLSLPRPEHPRPQFVRTTWKNLNGAWTFAFDHGLSGRERNLSRSTGFDNTILVPFCPESKLSGIQHTDFISCLWYHRTIEIPAVWDGKRLLLHFGGVDYDCEAFIDGQSVGRHYGGSVSFSFDITAQACPGQTQHLVICVVDDLRSGRQPCGKQSHRHDSYSCYYTRTTGIWQTVWLEAAHPQGLVDCRIRPDLDQSRFYLEPRFYSYRKGLKLRATLLDGEPVIAEETVTAAPGASLILSVPDPRPWSPEDPHLYDIRLELLDEEGKILETIASYAGLRKVHIEDDLVFLNNKPVYLRMVLDQGYYPDGIWTAPSDEALKRDIVLAQRAGFNGARLHQKVFEERFHYWADKLGYLTWGESASWGLSTHHLQHKMPGKNVLAPQEEAFLNFLTEWREIIERDRNHPSIIAWTPLNETSSAADWLFHARIHRELYDTTRALDPTRPINDASGYVHVKTDLYTVHNYKQTGKEIDQDMASADPDRIWRNYPDLDAKYQGQPYLVDEMGGIKWIPAQERQWAENSWGYGNAPKTEEDFYARLEDIVDAFLRAPHVRGYCYTQLTDVEQEQNGIYYYDRTDKFDMGRIAAIFRKKPKP